MKSLFRYQADPALEALADRFSDQGNGIVTHLEEFINPSRRVILKAIKSNFSKTKDGSLVIIRQRKRDYHQQEAERVAKCDRADSSGTKEFPHQN